MTMEDEKTTDSKKAEAYVALEDFVLDSFVKFENTISDCFKDVKPSGFECYMYGICDGLAIASNSVDRRRNFILDWMLESDPKAVNEKLDNIRNKLKSEKPK